MREPLAPNTARLTISFTVKYADRSSIIELALKNLDNVEYTTKQEADAARLEIQEDFEVALFEAIDPTNLQGDSEAFEVIEWESTLDALAPELTSEDLIRIAKKEEVERAELIKNGERLAGLNFIAESLEEVTEDGDDLAREQKDFSLIRGLIWAAAQITIDDLFEAVSMLDHARQRGETINANALPQIWDLPPQYQDRYDMVFARRFLIAASDVSANLANEWKPLPTVAHELALHLIIRQAENLADTYEFELFGGWSGMLKELLFEDADHEVLYMPQLDGIDEDPSLGMASLKFGDWFAPFNSGRHPSPYAAD